MEPSATDNLETISKGRWQWQSNSDPWSKTELPQWKAYSLDQNYLIEKEYFNEQKEVDLGDYLVYPRDLLQRKKGNLQAQRPIRRIDWMEDEEMHNRSARYFDSELPKTINRIFGGLGDFISFFSRRNKEMLEFTSLFQELEKSNDLDILNQKITPKLAHSLEEVLLNRLEEKLKDSSLSSFQKKLLAKGKGKIDELISSFQKIFSSFEEFYGQILKAYTMNTDLYPDLNQYLRDESWIKIDKLLPYAFCLCKAFFNLNLKKLNPGQQDPSAEPPLTKLYRGTAFDEFALSFYNKKKIQYFSWNSITSTTTNDKLAEEFMYNSVEMKKKKDPVMFIIELPDLKESEGYLKWLDIRKYSAIPKEDEVILPPGSVFELLEVITDQDKKTTIKLIVKNEVQTLAHGGLMMQGTLQSQMMTEKEAKVMCLDGEELSQALMSLHGNQLIEEIELSLCTFDRKLLTKMFEILPTLERLKKLKFIACYSEENEEIIDKTIQGKKCEITKIEVIEASNFFQMICSEKRSQKYWTALRELDLDFRSIRNLTDEELNRAISGLKYFPQLTHLNINLSGCQQITHKGVNSIAQGLSYLNQLERLGLFFQGCKQIADEDMSSLAKALSSLTQLTHLNLDFQKCKQITDEGLNCLAFQGLKNQTQLTSLTLSFMEYTQVTSKGVSSFWYPKCKYLSQLRSLNIASLQESKYVGVEMDIPQGLRNLAQLTSLTLKLVDYGDGEMDGLVFDGLKHILQLTSLSLSFSENTDAQITDHGLEILARHGLSSLASLTSLNLNFYQSREITNKGVKRLACQGLNNLIQLTSLALCFHESPEITHIGVESLMSQGLKNLTQMTSLTLDFFLCNQLTGPGMRVLASQWLKHLIPFKSLKTNRWKLWTVSSINLETRQDRIHPSRIQLARQNFHQLQQSENEELLSLIPKSVLQSQELFSQNLLEKLVPIFQKNEEIPDLRSNPETLEIFYTLPFLISLTLDFRKYSNLVTDEFLFHFTSQVLENTTQLRSLTLLFVNCYKITDEGVLCFALNGLEPLTNLSSLHLDFSGCLLTDEGVTELASEGISHLSRLTSLEINFGRIKDEGLINLARLGLGSLPQLTFLSLFLDSSITNKGIDDLIFYGLNYLPRLKSLTLEIPNSKVTDSGVNNLILQAVKNHPELTFLHLNFTGCLNVSDFTILNIIKVSHYFGFTEVIDDEDDSYEVYEDEDKNNKNNGI